MQHLSTREQRLLWDTVHALQAPLDLPELLAHTKEPLWKLIPVDHGALCVARAGSGDREYDWFGLDLQPDLFAGYGRVAEHDFVRRAALARPGVVLRDEEMLPRAELEQSVLYRSCRSRGLLLEQILTVLVPVEGAGHGGLTLYRGRRRPFSERERAALQQLTPALAAALRTHRLLGEAAWRGAALEAVLAREGRAAVLVAPSGVELFRSEGTEAVLRRWFAAVERRRGGLPDPLREEIARAAADLAGAAASKPWLRRGEEADLEVSVVPIATMGRPLLLVLLDERPRADALPREWRERLTPGEQRVVERVLRGWDNALIADDIGCALGTVKVHLRHVFNALGVPSRAALISLARQGR